MKPGESKYATPALLLIQEHYQKLGLDRAWDKDQALRLCALLRVTPFELGALVCVDCSTIKKYLKANRFPLTVSLHFHLLQSYYMERKYGMPSVPAMPVDFLNA